MGLELNRVPAPFSFGVTMNLKLREFISSLTEEQKEHFFRTAKQMSENYDLPRGECQKAVMEVILKLQNKQESKQ